MARHGGVRYKAVGVEVNSSMYRIGFPLETQREYNWSVCRFRVLAAMVIPNSQGTASRAWHISISFVSKSFVCASGTLGTAGC